MAAMPIELSLIPESSSEPSSRSKRLVALSVSASVTLGGLFLALYLGNVGYDIRRTSMHEARMTGVLRQEPTIYQVTEGLKEKAPLLEVLKTEEQIKQGAIQWGKTKVPQILSKASVSAETRVFAAGDMIYFVFFDAGSIMRDFELVSR